MNYELVEFLLQECLCETPDINVLDAPESDNDFYKLLHDNKFNNISPTKIIKVDNFYYGIYFRDKTDIMLILFKNKNINMDSAIAFTGFSLANKFNFPWISYTEVKHSELRNGYATKLYEYLINEYGGIISDDNISSNMKGIYIKLLDKYNRYVMDNHYKIKELKNIEFKPREMFLISKEKLDVDEWNSIT